MYLYFTRQENYNSTDDLIIKCMKDYFERKNLHFDIQMISIKRDVNGKPYLYDMPGTHFSVSHSGPYWGCAIDDSPIGLDMEDLSRKRLQYFEDEKNKRWEKIARRYFTEREFKFVREKGKEAFFQLWVRKEALLKYKGTGLRGKLSDHELIAEDRITERYEGIKFFEIKPYPCVICAYCSTKDKASENIIIERE